jgi:lysophospholipid acyltransferase (LPLAT)-like uncharacterized protein
VIEKWLVYLTYRFLISLWRVHAVESPELQALLAEKKAVIFAHWHGDEIALVYAIRRYKIATMVSTSKDGALMDFVIRRFGGATSRGSSTRGAVSALKGLVRLCRGGRNASVAVDGPKGPIYVPKPGVFELARLCHLPIVPCGVAYSRPHVFQKSWNKAALPLPFSKIVLYFGVPLPPLTKNDDPKSPELIKRLADELNGTKRQAAKIIAAL